MSPFQAFQKFQAWKMHFGKAGYDIVKYNGKFKCDYSVYDKRKDKYYFEKLSKKKNVDQYLIANLLENPSMWIGDIFSDSAEQRYTRWLKRQQSLSYIFSSEIKCLSDDFNENFKVVDGEHPILLKKFRRGEISPETLVILSEIVGFLPHWKKNIDDNYIWPETYLMIIKYSPFVKYDRNKILKLMKDRWIG